MTAGAARALSCSSPFVIAAIAAFGKENKITFVVEHGSFTYFVEATSITAAVQAKLKTPHPRGEVVWSSAPPAR